MKYDVEKLKKRASFAVLCLITCLFACAQAHAVTYSNTTYPFNWIDASAHAKLGYNTAPYKLNGLAGCGTTPPTLDDTISDAIPIGFNFLFGGVNFNTLRVMTNGRVQFNNNVTCGFGSPVTQLPYPDATLNYTMRIYGNDMDPTSKIDVPAYNTNCIDKSVCYMSYATLGVAPYRTFVVTWNNVPEWATGSNPTGSYNLQLILQENGEFIYQYGTDIPGPSAPLGQVGWQVDTSDYDAPQTGFPVNNSAIKFYIPQPVAEYRMEQSSWSLAAGQVIDSSGNGRHGTVLGSAQTIANGKVCRGGDFPGNANVGTIDAINSSIAVPTTVGGSGTITFWYKGDTAWSGGGVVDAQLLDASVVNNRWFFLVRRSNGRLRFVITDSGGTARVAETAAIAVAAGTWKHVAVTWSFNTLAAANSDHLRIYVDGVLQTESAFSTASTISAQIGTLYIGDNRSGFTGSNGTGNSANGAIDEFRIYNYEGGIALVLRDYNQGSVGCLNHYAISHAGTGDICQQTTVTVTAHDSSHSNIIMPNNTTTISLSTSTGKGDWVLINGYGVLDNGAADDGQATYLFNGEYQAVFGLMHSTAATVNINVSDGQIVEAASEDPSLVIGNKICSQRFNACELTSPRCVPSSSSNTYARLNTKLANNLFKIDLVKLKTDGTLENTFNGSVTVDLLANSQTGVEQGSNNCPNSQTAIIPLGNAAFASGYGPNLGVTVAANAFSSISPSYSAYRDVRVRFTCTPANCGSALVGCSTDNFAVRPTGLSVASSANADDSGSSASAPPAIKAGADFTLTVTALAGYDGTPKLDSNKVAAHSGAVQSVAPSGSFSSAVIATGAVTGTFKYSEVGYFNFAANGIYDDNFTVVDAGDCTDDFSNVAVGGKFGCKFGNTAATNYFGRFIPDHFSVVGAVSNACAAGNFTYMGQPFALYRSGDASKAQVVEARNSSEGVTSNYSGAFAKGTVSFGAENADNGTDLASRLALYSGGTYPALAGSWSSGIFTLTGNATAVAFKRPATVVPDATWGSFDSLDIGVTVDDADFSPSKMVSNANMNPGVAGGASFSYKKFSGSPLRMRNGRIVMTNAYGSELLDLPVVLETQYWKLKVPADSTTGYYATNTDDSCTTLPASSIIFSNFTNSLSACETWLSPSVTLTFSGGRVVPKLLKPGAGNIGSVDLTLNTGATASGNTCTSSTSSLATAANRLWFGTVNPSARATFGMRKTPLIYRRESY